MSFKGLYKRCWDASYFFCHISMLFGQLLQQICVSLLLLINYATSQLGAGGRFPVQDLEFDLIDQEMKTCV